MFSKKLRPQTIDEYISLTPTETQKKLIQLRKCILAAAPGATENLKWGMPAFSYQRILVTFALNKNHIGFHTTPSTIKAFKAELNGFRTSEGTIQFPLEKALPLTLIRKITMFRVRESLDGDVKWK